MSSISSPSNINGPGHCTTLEAHYKGFYIIVSLLRSLKNIRGYSGNSFVTFTDQLLLNWNQIGMNKNNELKFSHTTQHG